MLRLFSPLFTNVSHDCRSPSTFSFSAFLLRATFLVSRFTPLPLFPSFYLFLPGVHKHPHCQPPTPTSTPTPTASQHSILFSIPFLCSSPFSLFSVFLFSIICETLFLILTCLRCTFYRPNNGTTCILVRVTGHWP